MTASFTAHAAIAADPPRIPDVDVASALFAQYGIGGKLEPLVSERDQNFRVTAPDGRRFVAKVVGAGETVLAGAFHVAALQYLGGGGRIRTPRLLPTLGGEPTGGIEYDRRSYTLRVVSFLDGDLLADITIDEAVARNFGAHLAELDRALQGFSHAGQDPQLLWDLQRASELRGLLDHIDDDALRERVAHVVDDFEMRVQPRLGKLRTQVIHGDANPENVVVDRSGRRPFGFIDFGDMVSAPLVFDVAIAAAYLRVHGDDPLALIAPFVAAYQERLPLDDAESDLLFDLVRTRLAATISILFWRLAARRENDLYRQKSLRTEGGAIHFLEALDTLGRVHFGRRIAKM